MFTKEKVMIVDDDEFITNSLKTGLLEVGYQVTSIRKTGKDAISFASIEKPHLILMDVLLEGKMNGIEATTQIKKNINVPIIYISSSSDEHTLREIIKTNPSGYLIKPFRFEELLTAILVALKDSNINKPSKNSNLTKIKLLVLAKEITYKGMELAIKKNDKIELLHLINDCSQLLEGIEIYSPDILIIEQSMFKSVVDLLKMIKEASEDTKVVLFLDDCSTDLQLKCISQGVTGFLDKKNSRTEFTKALYVIYNNGTWFDKELLCSAFKKTLDSEKQIFSLKINLTKKENEVFNLAMKGLSNKHMSNDLFISENTVKTHLTNIYKKLDVNSKKGLILKYGNNKLN